MLLPSSFPAITDHSLSESAKLGVQNLFAFCYVWSIGGALNSQSREAFDAFVRTTFQGVANFPAGAGLVYDYYCDASRYAALLGRNSTVMCSCYISYDRRGKTWPMTRCKRSWLLQCAVHTLG